MKSRNR